MQIILFGWEKKTEYKMVIQHPQSERYQNGFGSPVDFSYLIDLLMSSPSNHTIKIKWMRSHKNQIYRINLQHAVPYIKFIYFHQLQNVCKSEADHINYICKSKKSHPSAHSIMTT